MKKETEKTEKEKSFRNEQKKAEMKRKYDEIIFQKKKNLI